MVHFGYEKKKAVDIGVSCPPQCTQSEMQRSHLEPCWVDFLGSEILADLKKLQKLVRSFTKGKKNVLRCRCLRARVGRLLGLGTRLPPPPPPSGPSGPT